MIKFEILNHPEHMSRVMRFAKVIDGKLYIARPNFELQERTTLLPGDCMFEVEERDLQALADMLWENGVKPTKASDGQISIDLFEATKRHLEDLRSLTVGRNE